MNISTSHRSSARPAIKFSSAPSSPAERAAMNRDSFQPGAASGKREEFKLGRAAAVTGGMAALTGLAASGLGVYSGVPAFLVGGFLGCALALNGMSSPKGAAEPSNAAAAVLGGLALVAGGVSGTFAAAMSQALGSPMIGLGAGLAAAVGTATYYAISE